VEVSASPIHDQHDGVVGAVVVAHDVTEARDLSAKLARLALHDNLTGLPNRVLLADRLEKALERAQRNGSAVSLLFVDLDRFKPVNDSLGHVVGDRLLQQVATRLQGCVRSSDTVCRYGGDEFIVMLPDIAHPHDAAICADKILASLSAPFSIGEHELNISASVGIAGSQSGATDSTTLMQQADAAMYQVKAEGRKGFRFFSPAAPHQPG
jgi:diguanylate cyclase (GGDEF)-like protein